LYGDSIRIFPDGTYTNRIFLTPKDIYKPYLLGLCMTLPIDYNLETTIPLVAEIDTVPLPAYDFDNIDENFNMQLSIYPQEKIHLHTDRDFYVPGEKIWIKAYVVDAHSHQYPTPSQYVYVELVSPADTIVNRIMIRQEDDMFYGHLPIFTDVPEGNYTLRAYTRYMENLGDDYFFKKNIRISPSPALPEREGRNDVARTLRQTAENTINSPLSGELEGAFDVSFFPEGGNLPAGIFSKVAFKALNKTGYPATVSGTLMDENGTTITSVKTLYAGMGILGYQPEAGKRYYLQCTDETGLEKRFELPQANPQAYALTASSNNNNLYVGVQHSAQTPLSPFGGGQGEEIFETQPSDSRLYLLAHCRGMLLYFAEWDKEKKAAVFEQNQFPAGVIQFILFDSQMNPLSERLVFNKNNDATATIEFQTDKDTYQIRDKIVATLLFADFQSGVALSPFGGGVGRGLEDYYKTPALNQPADSLLSRRSETLNQTDDWGGRFGHFSVSVTDDKDIAVDESTSILSSLLLSSELKGYIENPAYYLQDNPASNTALDLLMMTHGWRRYNVPKAVKGDVEYPLIPFQMDQEISGQVKSLLLSRPVADSEIFVVMKEGGVGITSTDINGLFVVQDLKFPDSTTIYIQALSKNGLDNVKLVIDEEKFPVLVYSPKSLAAERFETSEKTINESDINTFFVKAGQRAKFEEDMWTIQLNEVEVTARKIEKKDDPRLQFWANSSSNNTITRNDIEKYQGDNRTLADVIQMLEPGATVLISTNGTKTIRLRATMGRGNNATALLVIDGFVQEDEGAWRIPMITVESIDIFKGANGVVFGMRGAGGAISITTRRGVNSSFTEKANHVVYTPLGYQKPIEFYAPRYETLEARQSNTPDYRTTIFWKPDIVINDEGEASFEFYTSDFRTTYSVVIEGITLNGQIVRQVKKIMVE